MRTDIIEIDHHGNGFEKAAEETRKAAAYHGLTGKDSMHLQLCTEEMLSMVRSVTGGIQAKFWIDTEGKQYELHLSAQTVLDKEERAALISAATSRKNEAAHSFLGKIRDAFETALAADTEQGDPLPVEVWADLPNHSVDDSEWDGYERSILKKVSDQVKVSIRGGVVDLTVSKCFE